jgi:hypothetical protein
MNSLLKIGSGMISAYAYRGRPGGAAKRFLINITVPLVAALLLAGCVGGRWGRKYELLTPLSDDLRELKGSYENCYYVEDVPAVKRRTPLPTLWDRLVEQKGSWRTYTPRATDSVVLDPCSEGRIAVRLVRCEEVLSEATIACRRVGKRVRFDEHWSWWGVPLVLYSYRSGYNELGVDSAGNLHYLEFTDFAGGFLFLANSGSPRSFEVYARAKTNACFQVDGATLPTIRNDETAPAD